MRRLVLFLLGTVLSFSQVLYAQQISESEAKDKALSFFNSRPVTTNNGASRAPARGGTDANVQLAFKATDGTNNFFYVYNNGVNDGFVIIGGDAVAHEILAYVPQGHFNYDSIPDNVKWWLGEYAKEISVVKKMQLQNRPASAPRRTAQSGYTTSVEDLFTDIPDLITTKWNQTAPYNVAIPAVHHTNGDSIISPTGCVPTAIAQIMNYWHWPTTGVGSYSYTLDYGTLDEWSAGVNPGDYDGLLPATFSADFGNTNYDWANMVNEYTDSSSQVQIDAVSTLMYHVGVAGYTLYGPGGSGGGMDRTMEALKQYFGYSDRITLLNRGDYLDDEWEEIIYSEILAGRPVYYESDCHAFILHGYSANYKMFSVNWGWCGFMDGYWKITGTDYAYFVNDENYNLDFVNHGICIHIEPSNTVHPNNFSNVGDTIVVDGIRYDLIGPLSKTIEVTYAPNGEIIYEGELTIPDTIVYNNEKYTITKIGRYGLASGGYGVLMGGQANLAVLHLPNTLRSIAMGGLTGCGIKELQLPESVEMLGESCFDAMLNLTNVTLPSQLQYIPHYCFWQCRNLETIVLPDAIKALGYHSFYDCPSLSVLISNAVEVPTHNPEPGYSATFDQDLNGRVLVVPQVSVDDYRNDPIFGLWGSVVSIDSLPANFGERFTVDDIQYKLLASGEGVYAAGYVGDRRDTLIIPSAIIYEGITYPVKAIGPSAFAQLQNVETIIIEEGVEEIGAFSFQNSWISSVYLPTTLNIIRSYAFNNCQMLKSVYLPNGVTTIELWAFNGCWQMKSFEIPNTVVNIGSGVFSACDNLEYIKLSSSLTELPSNLLWRTKIKSIALPSEVTNIYNGCFAECDSLNTMVCYASIPPYVEIDNGLPVFPQNINRGKLYVPAEFISAYQSAPEWQSWGTILPIVPVDLIHLEDISIEKDASYTIPIQVFPSNVTEGQLFYSSSNPQIVKIDRYGVITAIGVGEATITAETMDGKTATCTVTVPSPRLFTIDDIQYKVISLGDEVSAIGYIGESKDILIIPSSIMYDSVTYPVRTIGPSAFKQLEGIKTIIIEEGVEEIGACSFENSWMSSVCLPASLKIIKESAFYNCYILKSVYLPNGITTIGNSAFSNCWQMTSFEMPNSVVSIGHGVLGYCYNLEYIKLSSSLTKLTSSVFCGTKIKTICIPSGVTSIYSACFYDCDSLNTMLCYASAVPHLEVGEGITPMFSSNIAQGTLYVPAESVSAYQAATGWQDWGTILPIVPVDSIHLENTTIWKNKHDTISIHVYPDNATEGQIFYSSSNPQIAKIDQNGIITAVGVGEATITAETMDGKTATCAVTVSPQSYVITGDVNDDGKVDISDYIGVANYILGNIPYGFNETAADVNNDGKIDISDYIGVANIILKGKP